MADKGIFQNVHNLGVSLRLPGIYLQFLNILFLQL